MTTKVVVTGLGLVTPVGNDVEECWASLVEGRSGIAKVEALAEWSVNDERLPTTVGGTVKGFDPEKWVDKKEARRMDPFILYAQAAAAQAWQNAGLPERLDDEVGNTAGCLVGVGLAGVGHILAMQETLVDRGPRRVSPLFIPAVIGNLAPGHIGMHYNLRGPNWTPAAGGASGSFAVGEAYQHIVDGRCDLMVAGGSESVLTPLVMLGFHRMEALSQHAERAPGSWPRPFSSDRDGAAIGEGSGILVLESKERADKRGQKALAELVGYACTSEPAGLAYDPSASAAARCMRDALAMAGIEPSAVGLVNAHGAGTVAGDAAEAEALREVFGAHLENVAVSATKSMTGDLLGGAGGAEAAFTVLSLMHQKAPATANLSGSSIVGGAVSGAARDVSTDYALCYNHGQGGTHTAMVFKRV